MTKPLVSVLVAARDAEQLIGEALASAQRQTYSTIEIIVVDDGSNDQTAAVVQAVATADPRIILVQQKNEGVARARNRAASLARGSLLAPLDADDLWHHRKIELQVAALTHDAGLVYCWSTIIDATGAVMGRGDLTARAEGYVYPRLLLGNFIGNASVPLIRRDAFERVGGYDPQLTYCEDFQLYLALAEQYPFVLVPESLVGYRQISGSMSSRTEAMSACYDLVLARARECHPEVSVRVFRRSRANFAFYLAKKRFVSRDVPGAAALLARSLAEDPVFPFRREPWRAVRRALSSAWEPKRSKFLASASGDPR